MKNKKVLVAIILVAVIAALVVSLAGCSKSGPTDTGNGNNNSNDNGNTDNGNTDNGNTDNNDTEVTYTFTIVIAHNDSQTYTYKANATIAQPQDPVRQDYIFEGWYLDSAGNEPYTFGIMPASNLTIYAKWKALTTYNYITMDAYMRSPSRESISTRVENYLKLSDGFLDGYVITEIHSNGNDEIEIPATYNGKPVYVIAASAANMGTFKKVHIPASIIFIGYGAFKNCTNLTDVTFQEDSYISGLSGSAFEGCTSLKEIVLPERLFEISSAVFRNCSELTTVYVEHKLDNRNNTDFQAPSWFGVFATSDMFDGCTKLESIYVHLENGDAPITNETGNGVAQYKDRDGWKNYSAFIKEYPVAL